MTDISNNLSRSHLKSQVIQVKAVGTCTLIYDVIGQQSCDVIGRLSVKH